MSPTTPLPLSVLDLSPVPRGGTAARALADTIELAGLAENLGYHRFWLAEHHLNPGVASASPAVLIALVASATRHIRVGSGAVQISHLTPLLVAEQFGTIAQVHPDRIDLGLGHLDLGALQRRRTAGPPSGGTVASARVVDGLLVPAPARFGGSIATFELLARLLGYRPNEERQSYQDQVRDLLAFLDGEYRDPAGRAVHAVPAEGADLQTWVLGSSGGVSAQTAGAVGLPFAAGYHAAPAGVLDAVAAYRAAFVPSVSSPRPYVMVSADVVVAETDAEARRLATPFASWVLDIRTGRGAQPYPTPDEAEWRRWTAEERAIVQDRVDTQIVGSPATVVERLRTLARVTGADELLITTITSEHSDRVRSYELLAEAWQAIGRGGTDSDAAAQSTEVDVSNPAVAGNGLPVEREARSEAGAGASRPRLAVELDGAGRHPAAWRLPDAKPDRLSTAEWYVESVRRAEEGGLDFVAITDAFTPYSDRPGQVAGRLDAVAIAARVAPVTSSIGLVPTATVTHTEPFHLSKALATLDFVSLGRAGWEVAVSQTQAEADLFGRKDAAAAEVLWAEASDAAEVVVRLWDSWDDDAEIREVATGRFIDRDRLHYIDFDGEFFSVRGPSITPRPPQGHPLIVVGVHDPEAIGTAATHADVVRVSAPDLDSARAIRSRVRAEVAEAGRDPDEVSVLLDLEVLLAADGAAARAVLGELDGWAGAAVPARSLRVVGAPGEVADLIEQGFRSGAFDGVVFAPLALPGGLISIVEDVLPVLAERGLAETAVERANAVRSQGLRARLGLPARAASRFAAAEEPVSSAPIEKTAVGTDDRQKEQTR